MRLFIFGYGFSARALVRRLKPQGWEVAATFRSEAGAAALACDGVQAASLDDPQRIAACAAAAKAILVTAPPGAAGCPALPLLVPALARAGAFPDWLGYLSTTGVYGDRRGG